MNLTPFEKDIFMDLQEYGQASFEHLEGIGYRHCREGYVSRNVIRVVVSKLRRKVETSGFQIRNERGWGYSLRGPK